MGDYRFDALRPSDHPALVALMRDAFGLDAPDDYFDWKYAQNPAGPAVGLLARAEDGEVAAFYGMIPMLYQSPHGPVTIYQSCDTMTSPRHRRKGLFQQLAQRLYAEAQERDPHFFIYGFGGPTSTPGFLKMGWKIVDQIPYLFEPWPLTTIRSIGRQAAGELEGAPDQSAEARVGTLVRSSDYLAWKARNPMRAGYSRVGAGRSSATYSKAKDFTFLIDFIDGAGGEGAAVLNAVREDSRGSKGILTFAQRSSEMYRALRRRGYWRNTLGRGPGSGKIPLISYGVCPWPESQWAVTPLDHDAY